MAYNEEEKAGGEAVGEFDLDERCPECGCSWAGGEPVHYADCRYFVLDGTAEESEEGTLAGG